MAFKAFASVASAAIQASAAKKAARLQADSADKATQVQRDALDFNKEVYNLGREDLAPYRSAGTTALASMADLFLPGGGRQIRIDPQINALQQQRATLTNRIDQALNRPAPPPPEFSGERENELGRPSFDYQQWQQRARDASAPQADVSGFESQIADIDAQINQLRQPADGEDSAGPDYSQFFKSPGYQFRLDEGTRALDRSAAARGRLLSGGHDRELLRYGQGFASNEFNNYANRLASLVSVGQNAAGSSSNLGAQAASTGGQISSNIGQGIQNAGAANASGIVGSANALQQGLRNLSYSNNGIRKFFPTTTSNGGGTGRAGGVGTPGVGGGFYGGGGGVGGGFSVLGR